MLPRRGYSKKHQTFHRTDILSAALTFRRLGQEDLELEVNLVYRGRLCLKTNKSKQILPNRKKKKTQREGGQHGLACLNCEGVTAQ